MLRRLALSAALLLPLAAGSLALAAGAAHVAVDQAWARATPGSAKVGAAYVTVTVTEADRLVSAASPVAGSVEIHSMITEDGLMKMRAVPDGLLVAPGKPLVLAPDGFHLMLKELKSPLKSGQTFPLTLVFQKAGPVQTVVTVGTASARGPAGAPATPMGGMKM